MGQPLTRNLWNADGQIWYGQMKDGSWVIGLFSEQAITTRTLDLSRIGLTGNWNVRDLWKHTDEGGGKTAKLEAQIPIHGCKIVKLTKSN